MIIEQKKADQVGVLPCPDSNFLQYRLPDIWITVNGKLSALFSALQGFLEQFLDSTYSSFLRENVLRCEV